MRHLQFPPRGTGLIGGRETAPSQRWVQPEQLGDTWTWEPGKVLLGKWGDRYIGRADGRHMLLAAGTQSGKSATVLLPNLKTWPGSKVTIDPKGELARLTAPARIAMGQSVHVLDPFGASGIPTSSYNPFSELNASHAGVLGAEVAEVADAIIINGKDSHWTDAAKNLTRGMILHMRHTTGRAPVMREYRRALNATNADLERMLSAMAESPIEQVANVGASFLGKMEGGPRELQSILSTAQEQTSSFDNLAHVMERSDFRLADLRHGRMSIYLVLPATKLTSHYRWLRLMLQMAIGALEKHPVPRHEHPVLFVLEELPVLGHLKAIETAAGLMAGYGVKLWSVIQDLSQLKQHYPRSWETFIGNCGIAQFFGNSDYTTMKYVSDVLGATQITERQQGPVSSAAMAHGDMGVRENQRTVRLLDPDEVKLFFARETNLQLILAAGRPPIYLERLRIGELPAARQPLSLNAQERRHP